MPKPIRLSAFLLCLFFFPVITLAGPNQAAIASGHPLATAAGFEILGQGGNAFDAAIAVSATLAVVEPSGSGLGGGGFWLLKRARDGKEIVVDGRETAPLSAHAAMYLDAQGNPIPQLSLDGPRAAGIPGLPAALAHLAKKYGRLPLLKSLGPAIRHAESGFEVGERYLKAVKSKEKILQAMPASAAIFLDRNAAPQPGFRLVQQDLAATLRRLGLAGHAGFYRGETAAKLVETVRTAGGLWTREDLQRYAVIERQPTVGEYRGIRIVSAPPPSSGGIVLVEALNILSAYDLQQADSVTRKHLIIEALRRAYRDRDVYLGDPDFVEIPVKRLTSQDYAAGLRVAIRSDRSLPSASLSDAASPIPQGDNTTHFSIIDRQGNQVAATLSINQSFGSGFVAEGTGVLLNDEMDDFAVSPGKPNAYGLVGGNANCIEPGKRMLSSMSPTFLQTPDRSAILGTPGGSRIISMVLLAVLDFAEGHGPKSWVSIGRFHHQYLPDVVEYEPGALNAEEIAGLEKLGHTLKATPKPYGDMQAVLWDQPYGRLEAASDPRGEGAAWVQH
jgi:gamma-glutamyltranspeptidase/glutathione hydrolase